MEYVMSFPADKAELSKLRAGDKLTVSGTIYTARDAAHKRLTELIASGEELPLDIRGAAIYYAGPTPEKPGQVIGSCGPTTSGRMDAYAPGLLDRGLAVMIGKGDRNAAVIDAIVRNGAVYLAAMGGAYMSIGDIHMFSRDMVAGRGFIAMAVVIFGGWHPVGAWLGSLLFGLAQSLQYRLQSGSIPPQLVQMLPYIVTLVVLVFARGSKHRAPAAEGRHYYAKGEQ